MESGGRGGRDGAGIKYKAISDGHGIRRKCRRAVGRPAIAAAHRDVLHPLLTLNLHRKPFFQCNTSLL